MRPNGLTCAVICVLLLTSVNGCQKGEPPPVSEAPSLEAPDQEMWESTIFLTVKGRNRARVWAGHILKYEEKQNIRMDGDIKVDFFDEAGEHVSVLTARTGEVDETSQDLRAAGTVVVISKDGAHLETERLKWNNATQKIESDTLVSITRNEETVTGVGFESDADLGHWTVKENVTGVLNRERSPLDESR